MRYVIILAVAFAFALGLGLDSSASSAQEPPACGDASAAQNYLAFATEMESRARRLQAAVSRARSPKEPFIIEPSDRNGAIKPFQDLFSTYDDIHNLMYAVRLHQLENDSSIVNAVRSVFPFSDNLFVSFKDHLREELEYVTTSGKPVALAETWTRGINPDLNTAEFRAGQIAKLAQLARQLALDAKNQDCAQDNVRVGEKDGARDQSRFENLLSEGASIGADARERMGAARADSSGPSNRNPYDRIARSQAQQTQSVVASTLGSGTQLPPGMGASVGAGSTSQIDQSQGLDPCNYQAANLVQSYQQRFSNAPNICTRADMEMELAGRLRQVKGTCRGPSPDIDNVISTLEQHVREVRASSCTGY